MLKEQLVKLVFLAALLITGGWVGANPSWDSWGSFFASLAAYGSVEIRQLRKLKALCYNDGDLALFRHFSDLFSPSSGCMQLLKDHDFGGLFHSKRLEPLHEFLVVWNDAPYEFVDRRLERQRKNAYAALDQFMTLLSANVFSDKGNVEWLSMDISNRPLTKELLNRKDKINTLASSAYLELQELIRLGRQVFRTVKDL